MSRVGLILILALGVCGCSAEGNDAGGAPGIATRLVYALLVLAGLTAFFATVTGLYLKLGPEKDREEEARGPFAVSLAICVFTIVLLLLVGLYRAVVEVGVAMISHWAVVGSILGGGIVIVVIVLLARAYNDLARRLNHVRRAKRAISALFERAGFGQEQLLHIAERAGAHEKETQIGVASGRRATSPFVIGQYSIRESPPTLTATPLFGTAQAEVREVERELQQAWQKWAEAAEEYENLRSSFPHALVATVCSFPRAFDSTDDD